MSKLLLIVWLQFLKKILGSASLKMRIKGGPNAGRLWKFGRTTNNEFIIGDWELPMQKVISKYLKKGDTVLDLGAHQGFLAMIMCDEVGPDGKVFSFEPLQRNFDLLSFHVRVNSISNCVPKFGAVSESSGTVRFTISEADVSNTYVSTSPAFSVLVKTAEVPSFSLDDLLKSGEIPCPQFIKVDVEGAEYDVLRGAVNLLENCSPIVYLETHDVHNAGVDTQCQGLLDKLGFERLETVAEPGNGFASYVFRKRLQKL
ncbi:MAG: FkbM family methyltransferase [Chryseolinea sp.]